MNKLEDKSFQANINYTKVKEKLLFDKYFNVPRKNKMDSLLEQVERLSSLKEESNVNIYPRLDNNMLNLITVVSDKFEKIKTTISERSARKLVTDDNFANRYIFNIKRAIINVEITRKEIERITKYITSSANLEDGGFVVNLPTPFLDHLNKGNNPAERILSILESISKSYRDGICTIALKNIKKRNDIGKTSKVEKYFSVNNNGNEKLLPIKYLLKDPVQSLLV